MSLDELLAHMAGCGQKSPVGISVEALNREWDALIRSVAPEEIAKMPRKE